MYVINDAYIIFKKNIPITVRCLSAICLENCALCGCNLAATAFFTPDPPPGFILRRRYCRSICCMIAGRHRSLSIGQRLKVPVALAVKLQNVRVEAPQRRPMRDGQQRDAGRFGRLVDGALDVNRNGAGALVEQGVLRPKRERGWCRINYAACYILKK